MLEGEEERGRERNERQQGSGRALAIAMQRVTDLGCDDKAAERTGSTRHTWLSSALRRSDWRARLDSSSLALCHSLVASATSSLHAQPLIAKCLRVVTGRLLLRRRSPWPRPEKATPVDQPEWLINCQAYHPS